MEALVLDEPSVSLGFEVEGVGANLSELDTSAFEAMISQVNSEFDNFKVVATTHPASGADYHC